MTIRTRALRFWTKFDRDWGWNLARLLGYTLLQALFAITGLQIVILALALRFTSPKTQNNVIASIARLLPDRVESSAFEVFARSLHATPAWLLIALIPVAVWYGSRLFAVLESALCVVFRRPRRAFLRQNTVAISLMLLFTVLLPVIVLSATAIPHIGVTPGFVITIADPDALSAYPWIPWLALLAGLAANFVLNQVAFTLLTPGGVPWRAAWPGALVAAALSQGYLLIFPLYARYVLHPSHFGTVAGFALVALVFLYAYGVCIIVGAEIAAFRAGYGPGAGDVTETMAHAARDAAPEPIAEPEPSVERIPALYPAATSVFEEQPTASTRVTVAPLLMPERD
jgi:membrane protein